MTTTDIGPVAIGTRVRVLRPRNDKGVVVRDVLGLSGQLALVVDPEQDKPNTEDWLNVEIEDSGKRWYLPTDRVAVVKGETSGS